MTTSYYTWPSKVYSEAMDVFQQLKKQGFDVWMYPPTVPEYAWQIGVNHATWDEKDFKRELKAALGGKAENHHNSGNLVVGDYFFEGPYDFAVTYPGDVCKNCGEQTPYKFRSIDYGEVEFGTHTVTHNVIMSGKETGQTFTQEECLPQQVTMEVSDWVNLCAKCAFPYLGDNEMTEGCVEMNVI